MRPLLATLRKRSQDADTILPALRKLASSAAVRAGLAAALGEIGDRRSIETLRRMAVDSGAATPSLKLLLDLF